MDSRIPDGFHTPKLTDTASTDFKKNADDAKKETIAKLKADEIGKSAAHKSLSEKLSDFREALPNEDLAAFNELLGDDSPNASATSPESTKLKDTVYLKPMDINLDASVFLKPMQRHLEDVVYLKPMQVHLEDAIYLKPMQVHFDDADNRKPS